MRLTLDPITRKENVGGSRPDHDWRCSGNQEVSTSILKNPITFKWESYATDMSFLLENFESLDKNISLLSKSDKKKFFQFLEKSLVLNGKTKLDGFNVLDCRSFLIKSHIEKLRLFR